MVVLSERENYLRNASMKGPEWIPMRVVLSGASWNEHREALANALGELLPADLRLDLHEALQALLAQCFRYRIWKIVRRSPLHRGVREAAHTVQPGLAQKFQQGLEILLGLTGKTNDEGAAQHQLRADFSPAR